MTGTGIAGAAEHGPAPDEPRCYVCGGQFKRQRGEWMCHAAKALPGVGLVEYCSAACTDAERPPGKGESMTTEPATDEELATWRLLAGGPGGERTPIARLIARIDKERERAESAELANSLLRSRARAASEGRAIAESEAAALRQEVERLREARRVIDFVLDVEGDHFNRSEFMETWRIGQSLDEWPEWPPFRDAALTKEPTPADKLAAPDDRDRDYIEHGLREEDLP